MKFAELKPGEFFRWMSGTYMKINTSGIYRCASLDDGLVYSVVDSVDVEKVEIDVRDN